MKRIVERLAVAAVSVLMFFASADALPLRVEGGGVVTVHMKNMAFEPSRIEVPPGTTVQWINDDPFDHDVTSGTVASGRAARKLSQTKFPDGRFQSGLFGQKKSYSFTFSKRGEHPYFCNIHPMMTGTVVVDE